MQIDQWNGRESPGIDSHKYSPLVFDRRAKATQWKEQRYSFQQMTWGQLDTQVQRNESNVQLLAIVHSAHASMKNAASYKN